MSFDPVSGAGDSPGSDSSRRSADLLLRHRPQLVEANDEPVIPPRREHVVFAQRLGHNVTAALVEHEALERALSPPVCEWTKITGITGVPALPLI